MGLLHTAVTRDGLCLLNTMPRLQWLGVRFCSLVCDARMSIGPIDHEAVKVLQEIEDWKED